MYDSWIKSYADAARIYSNVRFPENGKPLKRWCRMFKEGDDYVVKLVGWHGKSPEYFRVSPGDIVTFTLPVDEVRLYAHTIVNSTQRVIPVVLCRYKKGIYRLGSTQEFAIKTKEGVTPPYMWSGSGWKWLQREAPQYFNGMQFNIATGKCLNPQPDASTEVIPEQRKIWLRELKRYKRGLKTRIKVGALQGYVDKEVAERAQQPPHRRKSVNANWSSDLWIGKLVSCMQNEEYPAEILKRLVMSYEWRWGQGAFTQEELMWHVDRIFTTNSERLRREYGVFGKTLHEKT